MPDELEVKNKIIRLVRGDITSLEVECFVYYARPDLALGSGFGGAISVRGGPAIQEELKKIGAIQTGEAVVTSGGNLQARYIIHAAGPRFQEEDTEGKLCRTAHNVLRLAGEKGIRRLAFPAMGAGFYGVPPELSASVTLSAVKEHLEGETSLEEVIFCLRDSFDYNPFARQLREMGGRQK